MAEYNLKGINLRNDIIFKYVFASENSHDILISFLNAIFIHSRQEQITGITYLNPFNVKESIDEKSTVLDIKATDAKGRQYNIEMQVKSEPQFIERLIYYNSRLFAGQLKKGESYSDLRKTISIAITDFILFPEEKEFHNIFRLLNVKSYTLLSGIVEYHFLELPKYRESKKIGDVINKWLFAIKNAEKFIREPNKLPDSIKNEEYIMKAIHKMQKAASDPDVRAIIEYREKAELDNLNRLKTAIMEGEKRGIMLGKQEGIMLGKKEGIMLGKKEGVLEGKYMVAKQLLKLKVNQETISSATGLSIDEIRKLKKTSDV